MNTEAWLPQLIRPEIARLTAYSSARLEASANGGQLQLDANESPWPPYSPQFKQLRLNRYPEPQPQTLVSRLAQVYAVQPPQILVTRGMDEGIDLMCRVFCTPGKDQVMITPPTFGYYRVAAEVAGASITSLPLLEENDFLPSLQQFRQLYHAAIKLIFLCSPNNPTGNLLPLSIIEELCHLTAGKSIVIVDEAYLEFSGTDESTTALSATTLISRYPNLVVMKTLSKAYALAAARIGTVIASSPLIKVLRKVLPPYPLTEGSVAAAIDALGPIGQSYMTANLQTIRCQRQYLLNELGKVSDVLKVYPSEGNFLLIKVRDSQSFCQKLMARGIIIRNRSRDLENTVRISVGTPEENQLLLAALAIIPTPVPPKRQSCQSRKTKETEISVRVDLDSPSPVNIKTGIGFFDHMLEQLARHSGISLQLQCEGDIHIDTHHSIEDCAIVLGQAFRQALGLKIGIKRYGAIVPMDETLAQIALDLDGRGTLVFDAAFPSPYVGAFASEMVRHFFYTLAINLGASVHVSVKGSNTHHMIEGCFKAFGKALALAIAVEGTRLPSTKGVL